MKNNNQSSQGWTSIFWVALFFISFSSTQGFATPPVKKYTGPNRFATQAQRDRYLTRPDGGLVDPLDCEQQRRRAFEVGVITEEEYETLKDAGAAAQGGYYPIYMETYRLPSEKMVRAIVICGCFHPETSILSSFQRSPWGEFLAGAIASSVTEFDLVHLTEDSDLSHFQLTSSPVSHATGGPEKRDLVVITVSNGRTLKLTTKHPVLLSSGMMVEASTLQPLDELLSVTGQPLTISSIGSEHFSGNVVNFKVDSHYSRKTEHVIFAEGVAVGDLAWQSSLQEEMNKVFLRK